MEAITIVREQSPADQGHDDIYLVHDEPVGTVISNYDEQAMEGLAQPMHEEAPTRVDYEMTELREFPILSDLNREWVVIRMTSLYDHIKARYRLVALQDGPCDSDHDQEVIVTRPGGFYTWEQTCDQVVSCSCISSRTSESRRCCHIRALENTGYLDLA